MPKNTLAAFFTAGSMGFLGGILSLLVTYILFSQALVEDDSFYCVLVGVFINIFLPFFFCFLFLLPLSAIEKTKMEERSFTDLIKRYTPILTLPFGILFFSALVSSYSYGSDKCFLLVSLVNIFGVCAFSLWFFLKKIKST